MHPELGLWAGVRDMIAGAVLLAIGLATRASTFDGLPSDALDHVFDALAIFWFVWGLARVGFALARGARAADRPR
jgi:hypothetical protein